MTQATRVLSTPPTSTPIPDRIHGAPAYRTPLRSYLFRWREALVKQLLTPAPDTAAVIWKRAALAQGQYRFVGVKPERLESAIADDVAWLAAHPFRRGQL